MHNRLHTCTDLTKSRQRQQVLRCRSHCGHRPNTVGPVALAIFIELCVTDPLPVLIAPAVSHKLQHGFWCGTHATVEQVGRPKCSGIPDLDNSHLHNPESADPNLKNVLPYLLCPQRLDHVLFVADLVMSCPKRDMTLSLHLDVDLAG